MKIKYILICFFISLLIFNCSQVTDNKEKEDKNILTKDEIIIGSTVSDNMNNAVIGDLLPSIVSDLMENEANKNGSLPLNNKSGTIKTINIVIPDSFGTGNLTIQGQYTLTPMLLAYDIKIEAEAIYKDFKLNTDIGTIILNGTLDLNSIVNVNIYSAYYFISEDSDIGGSVKVTGVIDKNYDIKLKSKSVITLSVPSIKLLSINSSVNGVINNHKFSFTYSYNTLTK